MSDNSLLGDNLPDPAPAIIGRLTQDYRHFASNVSEHQDAAAEIPAELDTQEDHDKAADLVATMRGTFKAIEAARVSEKDPFLKSERAVDGYFNPLTERLTSTAKDLAARVKLWLDAKADAERRRRQEEAAAAQREAERLRAEQHKREEAAAEATRRDRKLAHEAKAATAGFAADNAEAAANAKQAEADVKPAALARTRTEDRGTLSTLKSEWQNTIEDYEAIPLDKLRPYIKREIVEAAIKRFVAMGGRELAGVHIFEGTKAVIR